MMMSLTRRLRREEEGYALVVAMLLLAIMMILMVVALDAGSSALQGASKGVEWSKTLTVAEAGVNDAVTRLGDSRIATNPCAMSSATVCTGGGGEYQVNWTATSTGGIVVTSIGYFPTKATAKFTREVQVTYEPAPTFKYALFSQDSLAIKNNPEVVGDVYSSGNVTVDNNVTICGSIISANGNVILGQNDQVLKTYAPYNCTGESGMVWAGGAVTGSNGVSVAGDVKASGPTSATCNPGNATYSISTMTVTGKATACGKISGVTAAGGTAPGTANTQPAVETMPAFVFDPNNYSTLSCYPTGGICGSNLSSTAVSNFNTYVAAHKTSLSGTFAIWQTNPSQSTVINLDGVSAIPGDVTIVSNAPINFGNTNTITTTATSAQLVVVSEYQPPTGTTCDVNGGDCSIYGQNSVEFGTGIVGLLYAGPSGKLAFKNNCNGAGCTQFDGALYANSMDLKNGFNVVYDSRIERVLGFGQSLQQTLWQELNV